VGMSVRFQPLIASLALIERHTRRAKVHPRN
jgi:hypothetical protein